MSTARSSRNQTGRSRPPQSVASSRLRESIEEDSYEDLIRKEREEILAREAERAREAVLRAKDLGIIPTPVTRSRVTLRLYTHRQSVFRAHSFLVGNEQGGLSEQLGSVAIQANRTTLEDLRQLIECVVDNNMVRRNPLYQDFLITVSMLPNPYGYSGKELRHYHFAYYASPSDPLPTMIPKETEAETLAAESVVNVLTDDLILVARSQLRPDFSLPDPEDHAVGR